MLITISGLPGSGKTTVAKLLSKKLHVPYYSIGGIRREMAKERGLTLEEFNALGEKKGFTDKDVDAWQKERGQKLTKGVFEGRLSFYFIPHSFKVFLKADQEVAAKRIFSDPASIRRFEATFGKLEHVQKSLRQRIASDTKRYIKYYGIDIFDEKGYNLVLDSTRRTPQRVVAMILDAVKKFTVVGEKKTVIHSAAKKKISPTSKKKICRVAKVSENNFRRGSYLTFSFFRAKLFLS